MGVAAAVVVALVAPAAAAIPARGAGAQPSTSVRIYRVGGQPDRVAVGPDAVWVGDSGHLFAVDPTSGAVRQASGVATPIATDGDSVWARPVVHPDMLVRLDAATLHVTATVPLGGTPAGISAGPHGVWVIDSTGTVTRVDPDTAAVVATLPVGSLGFSIAAAGDSVWASGRGADDAHAVLWRIDPTTNTLRAAMTTDADCMTLAGLGDALWAACSTAQRVETRGGLTPTPVDASDGITVGSPFVYALANDGTLTLLSPDTGRVARRAMVPPGSEGIAVGDGAIWIANPVLSETPTVGGRGTLTRLSAG